MTRRDDFDGAERLQHALDRLERLRTSGVAEDRARILAAANLDPETTKAFGIAAALTGAAATIEGPSITFAAALEERLKTVRPAAVRTTGRIYRFAVAAVLVLLLGVGAVASRSALPGDALYGTKRAQENLHLAMASGRNEAFVRLDLAERRIDEAHALIAQTQVRAIGRPGSVVAAGIELDERTAQLVSDVLRDAESQMRSAAAVLIELRDPEGLQRLAELRVKVANKPPAQRSFCPPDRRCRSWRPQQIFSGSNIEPWPHDRAPKRLLR